MQPKQKLRSLSLTCLIPFLGGLAYFVITGRRFDTVPRWVFVMAAIYLVSTWLLTMTYMVRHREELRDPPEERERQRQWALKNGPTMLRVILVLIVVSDLANLLFLRMGQFDSRRAGMSWFALIASLPAIALLLWVRHKALAKKLGRPQG